MKKSNYKLTVLAITSLGGLIATMNSTALLIALPDIAKDLRTSMEIIIWVIMAYMLLMTVLVPAIGRIADIFGRKRMYVWGFAVFAATSLIAGMAQTGVQLLVFRTLQAIGASLIIANSTAIVADAFHKKELGKALGINTMMLAVGLTIGPILGGILTVGLGWRWTFYINVPIGIIGTIWGWKGLKDIAALPSGQKFDWWGAATFTTGMFLLLMGLSFGGFNGWLSFEVIGSVIVSIALLGLFVYVESTAKDPMLDLRLFKSRVLAFAFTSNLLNGVARGALTFLLIFYLQGIKSMDPLMAGIFLTPFAVAMVVFSPISGILSDKYGSRFLSSFGLLITAFGLWGFTMITANTSLFEIAFWQVIVGIGSGIFNSPNTNTIMGVVPVERRGIASGTRTMMNNMGAVISIAMAFAITSSGMTPQAMQALFAGIQVGSKGIFVGVFIRDLRLAFYISAIISLFSAFISYMRGPTPVWKDGQHQEI